MNAAQEAILRAAQQLPDHLRKLLEDGFNRPTTQVDLSPAKPCRKRGRITELAAKAVKMISIVSGPKVDPETFDARSAKCDRCPHLKQRGTKRYCGACGCPNWHLAELNVKLWFAELECPKGEFKARR